MDFYGMQDSRLQPNIQPHVPKSELKNALCMYIQQSKNCMVTKVYEVDEIKEIARHACAKGGLLNLGMEQFTYRGVTVPYWFCGYCGTLRVWLDYE